MFGQPVIFMFLPQPQFNKGFTLVEIMVAVSIFAIVATIAVGALLSANAVNQKAQAIKLAMDNLNFAVDSITIRMRQGTNFVSSQTVVPNDTLTFDSPKGNPDLTVPKHYTYKWDITDGRGSLQMELSGKTTTLTSKELDIKKAFFDVKDSDGVKIATIIIEGSALVGHQEQTFAIETMVTERL